LGRSGGHASGALGRDDLKALGEVLYRRDAGLVVVYPQEIADRVSASVKAAGSKVHAVAGRVRRATRGRCADSGGEKRRLARRRVTVPANPRPPTPPFGFRQAVE
jgi:hypothetical protein